MKRLQQLFGPVLGAFYENEDRNSIAQDLFQDVQAFPAALAAGTVHDYRGAGSDPAEYWDFFEFLFCQWTELAWYDHAYSGKIQKGRMIADVDVGFAAVDFLPAIELVTDKRKLAENPTPDVKEKVSYRAQAEKVRQR
jgi:hypothetical protein